MEVTGYGRPLIVERVCVCVCVSVVCTCLFVFVCLRVGMYAVVGL